MQFLPFSSLNVISMPKYLKYGILISVRKFYEHFKQNQEILLSIKRIGINGEGIGYYKRLAVLFPAQFPAKKQLSASAMSSKNMPSVNCSVSKKNRRLIA